MPETITPEAVEQRLSAWAKIIERPTPDGDNSLLVDADVADEHAEDLRSLLSTLQAADERAERAEFLLALMATRAQFAEGNRIARDGHAETLRGIAAMDPATEGERMVQWARDGLSGYTEDTPATVKTLTDRALEAEATLQAVRGENERLREALTDLADYAESVTCQHETTKRGGSIWTICCDCGDRWADDEGGPPVFCEPPPITLARQALSTIRGEG